MSDRMAKPEDTVTGTMIVVVSGREQCTLLLHRAGLGRGFAGDWAWTPPTGRREPGERVESCAARELREETGLVATPARTPHGTEAFPIFLLEVDEVPEVRIDFDDEYDMFRWVGLDEAAALVAPAAVREPMLACLREVAARWAQPCSTGRQV